MNSVFKSDTVIDSINDKGILRLTLDLLHLKNILLVN